MFLLLITVMLMVTSCTDGGNNNQYANTKYYQGYDSLDIKFVQESPPTTFFYDPYGYNEIPIIVQVQNKGASDAYGALYVYGPSPYLVEIAGGQYPSGENMALYSYDDGSFSFNIGGVYVGLQNRGESTATGVELGLMIPDGKTYGMSAYTSYGQ